MLPHGLCCFCREWSGGVLSLPLLSAMPVGQWYRLPSAWAYRGVTKAPPRVAAALSPAGTAGALDWMAMRPEPHRPQLGRLPPVPEYPTRTQTKKQTPQQSPHRDPTTTYLCPTYLLTLQYLGREPSMV